MSPVVVSDVLGLGPPDAEALAFPREILNGAKSALLLFASGRCGAADGRWVADAGFENVTAIDWDAATLDPMMAKAPETWVKEEADILAWANDPLTWGRQWDHVSADPPSQLAPQIIELLPVWLRYARRQATITVYRHCFAGEPTLGAPELAHPPAGWHYVDLIRRSDFRGGIYWLVARREA